MSTWHEEDHPRDDDGKFTYKNGGSYHSSIKDMIEKQNKERKELERITDILYPTMKTKRKPYEIPPFAPRSEYDGKIEEIHRNPEDILYPTMKDIGGVAPNSPHIVMHMNTQLGGDVAEQGTTTGSAAEIQIPQNTNLGGGILNEYLPLTDYLYNKIENNANVTPANKTDNRFFSDDALKKARIFIHGAEGFAKDAYKDDRGIWTIGYGHIKNVKPGDTITQEQAEKLYAEDFKIHTDALKHVKTPLSDNEKVALASLIYNIGESQFRNSTVLQKLNQGDKQGAAEAFKMFCKETKYKVVNGKKIKYMEFSQGLYNRRLKETKLFLTPDQY